MSHTKALLGIALIFVLGIVVGIALSIGLSMKRTRNVAAGTPEELGALTTHRVHQIVRFTPDQHQKAMAIFTEAELAIAAEQEKIAPQLEAITRQARSDIRALLTPQQLPRLRTFPQPPSSTSSRP